MKFHSVAIDGPSGAGKSTMAKACAAILNYIYVDTGAIYRTVALDCLEHQADPERQEEVAALLDPSAIRIEYGADGLQHMMLRGKDVTAQIRENRVSICASKVSAIPAVRAFLLDTQRAFARNGNVIMDGRDIGTVVLPDADVKIYLTASAEERARRRQAELAERGETVPFDQILKQITDRDYADMHRDISPLRRAEDAVLVDTTGLNREESLNHLLQTIKQKTGDSINEKT